ncbi:transcription elongation factor TFIIS-like protein [Tanacetum coccineum]
MVITLEREVVNHTYSFYATSSQVHKSLIKAILTGSLYVERAKAGVDFGIFVRAQVSMLSKAGCKLLEIRCDEHDRLIGESQFVTHTVGRYCKVHGEIEGELSDEANVADPCKGAVSFESAMFEKRGRSISAQKYKYRSIMFNTKDAKKPYFIRKLLI